MLKPAMFSKLLMGLLISLCAVIVIVLPLPSAFAFSFSPDNVEQTLLAKSSSTQEPLVTLANQFIVSKEQLPSFLDRWAEIGKYMRKQPGFVSAELQKDILNSQEWVMSEQWTSLDAYKRAVSTEAFQSLVQNFPAKATWFAQDLFPSH